MDLDLLLQLGTSGAAALVAAAATDAWQSARDRFVRLLGRGDPVREEVMGRRLDALASEIEEAEDRAVTRQRLLPIWQTRLSDLIEEHPELAPQVERLSEDLRAVLPDPQRHWVQHITAAAPGATAQGVMFGSIINHAPMSRSEPPGADASSHS